VSAKQGKRNPYLTPAMARVLSWMANAENHKSTAYDDYDDGYLTEEGAQVWYGLKRTNVRLVNRLLNHCLITVREQSQGVTHYAINEDGRGCLTDPNYVPRIDRPNYGEVANETR
jgi:hypothetical protein